MKKTILNIIDFTVIMFKISFMMIYLFVNFNEID